MEKEANMTFKVDEFFTALQPYVAGGDALVIAHDHAGQEHRFATIETYYQ